MKIILTAALLVLPLRARSASFEDLLKTDYAGLAAAAPAAAASKREVLPEPELVKAEDGR